MKQNKKNTDLNKHLQGQTKPLIISAIALGVIVLGVALYFAFSPGGPFVGEAITTTPYSTTEGGIGQGQVNWYLGITNVVGGTETETYGGESFTVPLYVNFGTGQVPAVISGLRFKIQYDPAVVEYLNDFEKGPMLENYVPVNPISHSDNTITIYYNFDINKNSAYSKFTGVQHVGDFGFKIKIQNEIITGGQETLKEDAVLLSGTTGGILELSKVGVWSGDVNLLTNLPASYSVSVTARLPCPDADGDGFGVAGDLRQCEPGKRPQDDDAAKNVNSIYVDCDDTLDAVYPGATEECDSIDNDCDDQIDENWPQEPNTPPEDTDYLTGLCVGFKECLVDQNPQSATNSYLTNPNYNSDVDSCDAYDNDCDGDINEDAVGECEFGKYISGQLSGGSDGEPIAAQKAGNVYLADEVVNVNDLTGVYIFTNLYDVIAAYQDVDAEFTSSYCDRFGFGYVCVCENGNYYETDDENGVSNWKRVNYLSGIEETLVAGYSVSGFNILQLNGVDATCEW